MARFNVLDMRMMMKVHEEYQKKKRAAYAEKYAEWEAEQQRIADAEGVKKVFARELTYKAALVKGITSIGLAVLVGYYFFLAQQAGINFECTDPNPEFCNFRYFSMALSVVLLLPYVIESINVFFVLCSGFVEYARKGNNAYRILISDALTYEGVLFDRDRVFNFLNQRTITARFVQGVIAGIVLAIAFPFVTPVYVVWAFCWGTNKDKELAGLALVLIPEFYVTISLIPLSLVVINDSGSVNDVLVNLVALQIFSSIDDDLVRILLRPKKSVGSLIDNYLTAERESEAMQLMGNRIIMNETNSSQEGEETLV